MRSLRNVGPRTGAFVNGALIAIGTLGVIDNLAVHWLLGLHRAVPEPWATEVEIALVALSLGLLLVGLGQEIGARRSLPLSARRSAAPAGDGVEKPTR